MAQIICDKIHVNYGNQQALIDVSFEVQAGDYVCVVGSNGSGKSTLLKAMLGLLPIKSGSITFDDSLLKGQVGYLPQHINIQSDFPASVYEVVISGCLSQTKMRPFYTKREKELVNHSLQKLEIGDLRNFSFKNLSGGQQQRVLLARALCSSQRILFMDEPINGLDPIVARDFYQLVQKLNKEEKLTVFMTSHDIGEAMKYATRVIHLDRSLLFYGDINEYLLSDVSSRLIGGHHHGNH